MPRKINHGDAAPPLFLLVSVYVTPTSSPTKYPPHTPRNGWCPGQSPCARTYDLDQPRFIYLGLLSADLQDVSTLTIDGMDNISCFEPLPDGRVLVAASRSIHVLKGFPSAKWLRRRTLLLGLRAAQPPRHKRLARPLCVLQRLARLPTELWPSLFQYV